MNDKKIQAFNGMGSFSFYRRKKAYICTFMYKVSRRVSESKKGILRSQFFGMKHSIKETQLFKRHEPKKK